MCVCVCERQQTETAAAPVLLALSTVSEGAGLSRELWLCDAQIFVLTALGRRRCVRSCDHESLSFPGMFLKTLCLGGISRKISKFSDAADR